MSDSNSTFRFCKKCQVETERNAGGDCKACSKAQKAARRAANPEREKAIYASYCEENAESIKAKKAAYHAENCEQISAKRLAYYLANPDKAKAASLSVAAYYAANKDKEKARKAAYVIANSDRVKERKAEWRAENKDKVTAASAAWHAANPHARRVNQQNRNARKRENGGILSRGLAERLFELQRGMCPCCKQPLGEDYHLDHKMPLALGGSNTDGNMQLLRQQCNNQKHAKHPIDFMQSRGFLL